MENTTGAVQSVVLGTGHSAEVSAAWSGIGTGIGSNEAMHVLVHEARGNTSSKHKVPLGLSRHSLTHRSMASDCCRPKTVLSDSQVSSSQNKVTSLTALPPGHVMLVALEHTSDCGARIKPQQHCQGNASQPHDPGGCSML
jgi:hypothetical protein